MENRKDLYAKSKALELLSRKPYSKNGLYKKLIEKGIEEEDAQKTCTYLEEIGYINDESFANETMQYLFQFKKFGKSRVIYELSKLGIEKDYAKDIVEEYLLENENELDSVLNALIRNKDLSDKKVFRQVFNKLVRLGYNFDEINKTLREYENGEWIFED